MFHMFFAQNKPGNLPRLTEFESFNLERNITFDLLDLDLDL